MLRIVNEAFYVVDEQIAQCESDIDVAIVLGTGFPDFRGGAFEYAYDLGIDNVICRLESLAERFDERLRLCKFLQNKIGV